MTPRPQLIHVCVKEVAEYVNPATLKPEKEDSAPEGMYPKDRTKFNPPQANTFNPNVPIARDAVKVNLLPVELLTDLDNDGLIGGADSELAQKAFESGASKEDIDKGTEYVFVNNRLSNGLADKEDVFAQGVTEDDDAEAIKVTLNADFGTVRFDHPAIDKFEFYESKECVNLLTFPMDLSVEDLPETIYLRTKDLSAGWNGQVEGDLVLKFKPIDNGEEIDAAKLKLTVVESLGDEKFFHACRDYMHENNSGKYIHDKGFPEHSDDPETTIRMCCMLEETAFMQTIETSNKPNKIKGIRAVIKANPHLDVLVNGNLVFFSDPDYNSLVFQALADFRRGTFGKMTDLCNGRILEVGRNSLSSRDEAPVISGLNPNLAGPEGRYVAQHTDGTFTFAQGKVPLAGDINHAIGGLHTDYGSNDAKNWPIQMLGYGKADEDGRGVVFTATGLTLAQGKGKGAEFKRAAERSGVPPAAGVGRIKLFFLDFGQTSTALAHSNTSGVLTHIWSGQKHNGYRYYVNTYVGFIARKPRP